MAEREGEVKNLLMKMKEESERDGLKLNIQNTKIMASITKIMALVPLLHGKCRENENSDRFYFLELQNHCGQ